MKLKILTTVVVIFGLGLWSLILGAMYNHVNASKNVVTQMPNALDTSNTETQGTTVAVAQASLAPAKSATGSISNSKIVKVMDSPKLLKIPKIGLSANIESVGLDSQKRMAVPQSWSDVGWYNLGYKIGDKGSAVIDGHYDTVTGSPASFYKLGSLSKGDLIQVTDTSGVTLTFKVTNKVSYPWNNLPLQQIFATSGKVGLNLITCAGSWDSTTHNYKNRVVIYSELQ